MCQSVSLDLVHVVVTCDKFWNYFEYLENFVG